MWGISSSKVFSPKLDVVQKIFVDPKPYLLGFLNECVYVLGEKLRDDKLISRDQLLCKKNRY